MDNPLQRLKQLHQKGMESDFAGSDRGILSEVRMIGGGLVLVLVITLVLTEVYNAITIDSSSPFYDVVTSLESTGVAAMTLLVVGFLVIAASAIMRYFGGGFGGGAR